HGVEVPFFELYCDQGKLAAAGETGTWIYLHFNSASWLANERMRAPFATASGAALLRVPAHSRELHGSPVYEPHINSGRADAAVVFARGGLSPYHLIGRATYLEARLKHDQAQLDELKKHANPKAQKYVD